MRILLVEDDKAIADGLVFCLKREEFQVFCAYNGNDALTLFSQNHFDMLILDIGLPDINGLKLYKKLKEAINGLASVGFSTDVSPEKGFPRKRSSGGLLILQCYKTAKPLQKTAAYSASGAYSFVSLVRYA